MILENDRVDRYELSSLAYCFCGGGVLPMEVFNRWQQHFTIPIYQVCGSTEVGHVCYTAASVNPPNPAPSACP